MPRRATCLLVLLSIAPVLGAAEVSRSAGSPVPAAPAATTPPETKITRWELLGLLGSGPTAVVRIRDTEENVATWVRVGESFGPLKLIAADGAANTATIQVGDERSILRLRAATVTAGKAAPPAAETPSDSTALTPPPLPSTGDAEADARRDQAIAEREARMLVSDLLEISMIQRKAYEEKQAAAEAAR